jgi:diadenosine tetraphosphatase ApaH/serine/threonine PP2A family protein phosphatase
MKFTGFTPAAAELLQNYSWPGNIRELKNVIERTMILAPEGDIDAACRPEDTLVFLGDYIDRGPDTRGCVDRIMRLKAGADFAVVTLLGNHEQWMLKSLADPKSHSWVIGMEAFDTIESYSQHAARVLRSALEQAGIRLVTGKVSLPYHVFFDLMPPDHLKFFQQLDLFYRTPDVICVHAGVDLEGRLASEDSNIFTWGTGGFPDEYRGEQPVVYGHWNNTGEDENGLPRPLVRQNRTYGIDTIAKGVLTAMRFPDTKIFQSKRLA